MSKTPRRDDSPRLSADYSALSLVVDIADTSWRMFVPTVSMILVGAWLDAKLGSAPYMVVAGAVVGAFVSFLLIKKLLTTIAKT